MYLMNNTELNPTQRTRLKTIIKYVRKSYNCKAINPPDEVIEAISEMLYTNFIFSLEEIVKGIEKLIQSDPSNIRHGYKEIKQYIWDSMPSHKKFSDYDRARDEEINSGKISEITKLIDKKEQKEE